VAKSELNLSKGEWSGQQIVLDSVSRILTKDNLEVDTSLSGKEGLAKALEGDYDVVFTDIRMPDIGEM